jgi:ABC-type phosphate/phosphonate transport system substrate-binding protein
MDITARLHRLCLPLGLLACALLVAGVVRSQERGKATDLLKIGTSGSLAEGTSGGDEKGAMETLRKFVQSETGFQNEIIQQKGWEDLAKKLASNEVQVGVFQGYEFAWAKAKYPQLRPLALAVNASDPYRYAYLITTRNSKAKSFQDMKGATITIPKAAQGYQKIFLYSLARKADSPLQSFFSKITYTDNAEDAIDDLVDGNVQGACMDRASLEAYKRRKPGRFNQLKLIAKSDKIPPTVIAVYGDKLTKDTQDRFTTGLLNADQKERGRTLLSYFKIIGFVKVPSDFDQVLAQSRKQFPAPAQAAE